MYSFEIVREDEKYCNVTKDKRYSVVLETVPYFLEGKSFFNTLYFSSKKKAFAFCSQLSIFCEHSINFLELINTRINVIQIDKKYNSKRFFNLKSRVYQCFEQFSESSIKVQACCLIFLIKRCSCLLSLLLKEIYLINKFLSNSLFALLLEFDENFQNKVTLAHRTNTIKFF